MRLILETCIWIFVSPPPTTHTHTLSTWYWYYVSVLYEWNLIAWKTVESDLESCGFALQHAWRHSLRLTIVLGAIQVKHYRVAGGWKLFGPLRLYLIACITVQIEVNIIRAGHSIVSWPSLKQWPMSHIWWRWLDEVHILPQSPNEKRVKWKLTTPYIAYNDHWENRQDPNHARHDKCIE